MGPKPATKPAADVVDGKNVEDPLGESNLPPPQPPVSLAGNPAHLLLNPALLAPPYPSPPKSENISSVALIDLPVCYLYDRGTWADFKKALNECGGTWNLPDWMTTIVRGGVEWKRMMSAGVALDKYFPITEKTKAGDGLHSKNSVLGLDLIAAFGLPKNLGESIRPSVQYCCLGTVEYEDERRLPARQKL